MKLLGITRLGAKLLALHLLIIGTTLVGIFSALVTREYFAQRRELIADLQELVKTQSVPISAALWELDTGKIDTFLGEVGKLPFVQGAVVVDGTGFLISTIGDIDTPPKNAEFSAQALLVFRDGASPQTLGSIKIIAHDREIRSTISERLAEDAIVLLVLLVALTGATILVTNRIVGRPLALLQASIQKIRKGGGYERVDWAASDELGKVVKAYNKLQALREDTEDALRRARDDLELRVHERTAELRETNESLVAEIKERKRAEDALRESEMRAKATLNAATHLQGLLKPDGTLIEANAAALDMIDAGKEDVVGQPFWDCPWWTHSPDLQVRVRRAVKRAADGETVQFLATHPAPDGSERIIDFHARPVTDENGEVVLVVPEGHDITELKLAEARLRESEARAKAMLNTGSQLQGLLKPDGTLIEINAAALAMISASEEDVLGLPFWDCPWWTHDPDLQAQLKRALKRAADGESVQFLATHQATDGIAHIINFGATPVKDEHGEVTLIVPMGDDITHLKQAEAELREAKEQAESALTELTTTQQQLVQSEKMASLGQLTAGIAHEIKNPLNFVNNFAEVSRELIEEFRELIEPLRETLGEEANAELDDLVTLLSENLDRITSQGQRANNIVNSMLLHSRGDPGQRRRADINELVEESLSLAYHGARAKDPAFEIALEREFDPKAGSAVVAPQEISRVLLNLFQNAFDAVGERASNGASNGFRPTLQVATRDLGDQVELRVRDNGAGIPDAAMDKVFNPFFTTKAAGAGTGLGLSLSYDIVVQQHLGQMTVRSKVNDHTEFTIALPRDAATPGGTQ